MVERSTITHLENQIMINPYAVVQLTEEDSSGLIVWAEFHSLSSADKYAEKLGNKFINASFDVMHRKTPDSPFTYPD